MSWKFGLLASAKNPDLQIFTNDQITVVKDMYPKAELHYLVLPKERIDTLKNLQKDHVNLLKSMHEIGLELASKKCQNRSIKLGYHAMPSMQQLHLHVISEDFDSVCLKTAKHWNSFTTPFFIDSLRAIKDLEATGRVMVPSTSECQQLLKTKLKCHKCDECFKNMPKLKMHIKQHL
ncbi:hypothetical protein AAG570_013700 [Ranatra chinensis]|uniref:Aprataxin n=1 Tax=Ranatra chinensis TaxID=642074 RepID=A0ABD0YCZ6_9HEMI